jgi:hypothetical protein
MASRRLFNVKGLFRMLSCEALPFLEPFGFPPLNVAIHWQDYIARSGLTPTGQSQKITPGIHRKTE